MVVLWALTRTRSLVPTSTLNLVISPWYFFFLTGWELLRSYWLFFGKRRRRKVENSNKLEKKGPTTCVISTLRTVLYSCSVDVDRLTPHAISLNAATCKTKETQWACPLCSISGEKKSTDFIKYHTRRNSKRGSVLDFSMREESINGMRSEPTRGGPSEWISSLDLM